MMRFIVLFRMPMRIIIGAIVMIIGIWKLAVMIIQKESNQDAPLL